jgi:hypothetical protein
MKQKKYKAFLEIRNRPHRKGPDKYIAVQVVPIGQQKLKILNSRIAAIRGIDVIHCGEGYSNRQNNPHSMYNIAIRKAKEIINLINLTGDYRGPRYYSKKFS